MQGRWRKRIMSGKWELDQMPKPKGQPPKILKSIQDSPGDNGRGVLRLKWATPRYIEHELDVMAGETKMVGFVEDHEIIEDIPYADATDRDRIAERHPLDGVLILDLPDPADQNGIAKLFRWPA